MIETLESQIMNTLTFFEFVYLEVEIFNEVGVFAKMNCSNTEHVASRLHLPKNKITEFKVTDMTYTYFIVFPGSVGRDGSVGIATRYGLDGPGIDSRWGRDFQHPSRPALGPTQPPIHWVPGLFLGSKGTGA